MKNKLRKTGMMIAAAVLLVALAFAGAASAADIPIDTAEELKDGLDTLAEDTVRGLDVPTGSLFVNISNANTNQVTLILGTTKITAFNTTTLPVGTSNTTLSNLDDGVYTLFGYYINSSVSTGVIKMATISGGSGYVDLVFPQQNITSGLYTDAEPGVSEPYVSVDGLDTIVGAEPAPAAGKQIIFNFIAIGKVYNASNANQTQLRTEILAHTPNAEITYLYFTIIKSTTNSTTEDVESDEVESDEVIADPANLMTIYMDYDMTNRQNIQVWRIHNGAAEQLQELASGDTPSDGTYQLDGTKGVFIYSKHFSSYAVSSTASSATKSSPAPIAGLIAGLGAAAVVLAKLRK